MPKRYVITIRIILWSALAVFLACLAYLKIVPSGRISYSYNFKRPSYFIGKLTPPERVSLNPGSASLTGEPVYFSLRTPRRFERAQVIVKFKNNTALPIVELGILNNKATWSNDLKPLQNKIIDQLSSSWPTVRSGDLYLLQREKKYQTIDEFLGRLPAAGEIALYYFDLKNNFLIDEYKPQTESRTLEANFRGAFQFYTYIRDEELSYDFNFEDLNDNKDSDPIDIKVYSSDGLIYEDHLADDPAAGAERQISIRLPDLPTGAYRLSLIVNDDIVTKKIITPQSRFAIINKFWLAGGNAKNLSFYTNSRALSVQTVNPGSLGKIKAGETMIDLNETYKQFSSKVVVPQAEKSATAGESSYVKVDLAKDDIMISGDGVFSFAESGLIDPRFKIVNQGTDVDEEKINYILTDYQKPPETDGWLSASADFDLTKAYQENGKYQFLISIPGRGSGAEAGGNLEIKEIIVNLSGTSLRQKLNKYLGR